LAYPRGYICGFNPIFGLESVRDEKTDEVASLCA
jgi:hypothetical protein